MTMLDTVRHVSAALDLPQSTVRDVLLATAGYVERTVAGGGKATVPGLGTIEGVWRAPRTVRSIADARKMYVGGRFAVRFNPSSALRRVVEERAPRVWRSPEHQAAWRLAETLVADLTLYHGAKAPSLEGELAPDAIHARCQSAFGELWTRARAEWTERVPAAVASHHDYLAQAAATRWAIARPPRFARANAQSP